MPDIAIATVISDLRAKLAAAEGLQLELNAEVQEISYAAHVDREPKAVKRLAEISHQLEHVIGGEIKSLTAALAEAAKREVAAQEAARAELRRKNARKAADVLLEVEALATTITTALADLRKNSLQLEAKLAEIRRLTGAAPSSEAIRVNLGRALKTALMASPMQLEHLAPSERVTVADIVGPWARSITNWITAAIGEKPAKAA
jgi:chromosome segregation ATPase